MNNINDYIAEKLNLDGAVKQYNKSLECSKKFGDGEMMLLSNVKFMYKNDDITDLVYKNGKQLFKKYNISKNDTVFVISGQGSLLAEFTRKHIITPEFQEIIRKLRGDFIEFSSKKYNSIDVDIDMSITAADDNIVIIEYRDWSEDVAKIMWIIKV